MNPTTANTTSSQPQVAMADGPQRRWQQVLIVAVVALLIIAVGVWLARSQGASELGRGGVNSHLLPKAGEPAPEFMTLYADGEVFRLSELRGQPVWLNFWGSWCPPCRAEMPELQAAWEQLEPRGLVMIGASMQEDPRDSVAYAERVGATFPITVDPNYLAAVADPQAFPDLFETATTWQIRNFPTHVFIDREGIVRVVVIEQMTTEEAIRYAEMILSEASTKTDDEAAVEDAPRSMASRMADALVGRRNRGTDRAGLVPSSPTIGVGARATEMAVTRGRGTRGWQRWWALLAIVLTLSFLDHDAGLAVAPHGYDAAGWSPAPRLAPGVDLDQREPPTAPDRLCESHDAGWLTAAPERPVPWTVRGGAEPDVDHGDDGTRTTAVEALPLSYDTRLALLQVFLI